MMDFILLGEPKTRRTEYFRKAAQELKTEVKFCEIQNFHPEEFPPSFLKIDPYYYEKSCIEQIDEFTTEYKVILKRLQDSRHLFLNSPEGILQALDKKECKERLQENHIPTTQLIADSVENIEQLNELIDVNHLQGVFIKPRFGSGAAGVMAYRFNKRLNRCVLYTSAQMRKEKLINTKKLQRIEDKVEIQQILDKIKNVQYIVEAWYTKASFQGKAYDIRVVIQFGKVDFMIARQSKGPITNLHLNNGALPLKELKLSEQKTEEIIQLCTKAMKAFPKLHYAGIDVLLLENSLKPYVIEVNGQGDYIYQDLFHENRIYKNQILYYKKEIQNGTI